MKNLFLLLVLAVSMLTTVGCGGDDDGGGGNNPDLCLLTTYNSRVLTSLQEFQAAANAYGNDPTTANCEAFRASAQDYLDVLREFETCADIVNTPDYIESVQEAEAEIAALQC